MPEQPLRIGVIGLGRAFTLMLPTFLRDPRVRLVAACDPIAAAREQFVRDFGGNAYADADALCADAAVELVYVASPHQFHAAHVSLAARAGRHVLLEKPMAITLDGTRLTLPVPIVAAASTILDMLEADGPALVAELHEKRDYARKTLTEIGFDLGKSSTHIIPVMCRDERKALFMHVALLESGVMMVPIVYPGVKVGEERLRVNITRGHSRQDIDMAIELLKTYGEAFYVLSGEELGPMEGDTPSAPTP